MKQSIFKNLKVIFCLSAPISICKLFPRALIYCNFYYIVRLQGVWSDVAKNNGLKIKRFVSEWIVSRRLKNVLQ